MSSPVIPARSLARKRLKLGLGFARQLSRSLALMTLAACGLGSAQAAILNWDPDGNPTNGLGGTGTWDTINARFDDDGIAPDTIWNNMLANTAVFDGASGAVTLAEAITAEALTFEVGGYTI